MAGRPTARPGNAQDVPAHRPEPGDGKDAAEPTDAQDGPDALLWAALSLAPADGVTVADLINVTGMSRRWIYYRLRQLINSGQAVQTERGTWHAAVSGGDAE